METPRRQGRGEPPPGSLADEIRRALVNKDLDAFAAAYAEDAVLEEVSSLHPPSHPAIARGREAILTRMREEILRDPISGWARQIQRAELAFAIETDDAIAFVEERTYEAGDKVVAEHVARKKDGRIGHDRVIVAWDAD